MTVREIARALESWRSAVRELAETTPGTDAHAALSEKVERARLEYARLQAAAQGTGEDPRPGVSERSMEPVLEPDVARG